MKKRNVLSWLAGIGMLCAALVASLSAAAPCLIYFHQPTTPANLKERLRNL
jgi:cyclic lactone autoinducer peptide